MKTQRQSQPDLHVVTVHDVDYFIYWDQLKVGASFFLPTTATAKQVLAALKPTAQTLRYKLVARPRREYGRYGVRVWRMD